MLNALSLAAWCEITFTKKDGSTRFVEMATRNMEQIPTIHRPKNDQPRAENLDTIRYYDINLGEWRSFRVDSVSHFNPVPMF